MKKVLTLMLTVMLMFMLAVSAMPVGFTPSAEANEAPEVVETTDSEGNTCAAVLTEADGSETPVAAADEAAGADDIVLEVTAVSKADDAPTPALAEKLVTAAETVKAADSVTDLVPEIAGALEVIKAASTDPAQKEVTIADLVVHDLFDASLLKNGEVIEVPEGGSIRFSLKTTLKPGDIFFVIHNYEGDKWELVNDAVLAADGTLTVTVDSLSPFAIISVGAPAAPAVESGATVPTSPQTGDSFPTMYLVFAVLFAAASAVSFIKARKHNA